jgi:rare lipoprotein A
MRRTTIRVMAAAAVLSFAALSPLLAAEKESSNTGTETGMAACYSRHLKGHRTSSGQPYDPNALTASHARFPVGTHVKVTNVENGKSVVVLVNDHMSGHRHRKIIMDVSQQACKELEFGKSGEAKVKLEVEPSNSDTSSH